MYENLDFIIFLVFFWCINFEIFELFFYNYKYKLKKKVMSIPIDHFALKNILSSNSVVYDYLVEKKGYFLDPISHRAIN